MLKYPNEFNGIHPIVSSQSYKYTLSLAQHLLHNKQSIGLIEGIVNVMHKESHVKTMGRFFINKDTKTDKYSYTEHFIGCSHLE
jgi:hypothetical protein